MSKGAYKDGYNRGRKGLPCNPPPYPFFYDLRSWKDGWSVGHDLFNQEQDQMQEELLSIKEDRAEILEHLIKALKENPDLCEELKELVNG